VLQTIEHVVNTVKPLLMDTSLLQTVLSVLTKWPWALNLSPREQIHINVPSLHWTKQ